MVDYNSIPSSEINLKGMKLYSFDIKSQTNIDLKTVKSFGEEWSKFDSFSEIEIQTAGDQYFDIVDEEILNNDSLCLDVGCGSGRWTHYVAKKARFVEAIDPSDAVLAAAELLKDFKNVRVTQAGVDNIPFADNTFDFVFSLGVLHHIPDTFDALKKSAQKVKHGGHFLIYLYYSLDNRNAFYKILFHFSNLLRKIISSLPGKIKRILCDILALLVYMPFVFVSRLLVGITGTNSIVKNIPLSYYRDKSFNIIRNDSLDRFGTPLEQRFSKKQIERMMREVGLVDIKFSSGEPYWHAIGRKI